MPRPLLPAPSPFARSLFGDTVQLVIENIAEALGEDEREDVVLELRRILRASNGTSGVPDPGFEGFVVTIFHSGFPGRDDYCLAHND